jgi:dCTP deaminase
LLGLSAYQVVIRFISDERLRNGEDVILSNIEIQRAMDEGRLVIAPEPLPRRPEAGEYCPYDTHAVDLRLYQEITIPQAGPHAYDVTERGTLSEVIAGHSQRVALTEANPYLLQPQQFILGRTLERIELPVNKGTPHLAARIEGKSSRARCGLMVHFTSPTVHPGWVGPLTLEMINLGPQTIVLRPGMHIAQLIVEEVRGEIFLNPSEFHGQSTPEGLA